MAGLSSGTEPIIAITGKSREAQATAAILAVRSGCALITVQCHRSAHSGVLKHRGGGSGEHGSSSSPDKYAQTGRF